MAEATRVTAPTLADVARRAGVSPATASRVLNNSPHAVTQDLRERVLNATRDLDYLPNAHAQALARSSTSTVGVIIHDVGDPYFADVTEGILHAASSAGRLVMLCNTYREPDKELEYVGLLRAHRVESIVMAASGLDDREYSVKLAAQVAPFIAAGGRVSFIGRHHVAGDAVLPDNVGGARSLAVALVELGHRRIGVISGPGVLTTTRDRLDGLLGGLRHAGAPVPDELVVAGDFRRDGGAKAAEDLLDRAPDITAIVALNDSMAVGALATLRRRGIPVPGDMSVTGFDDITASRDVTPALSTVRVPMKQLGARAMELTLDPPAPHLRIEHLPTELVLRESTGPPRR